MNAMDAMVQLGVLACNDIRAGKSLPSVLGDVVRKMAGTPGTANTPGSVIKSGAPLYIILTATKHLCPEFFADTVTGAHDLGWITDPPRN